VNDYFHSVTLDQDKCVGCTNCIKRCPTEAIRVHEGKAKIIAERCIDCGECIRVCPQHAKLAITDSLEGIKAYRYPVAIPAPTLYGQFPGKYSVDQIISSLLQLGFFRVWEVARGAEIVTQATREFLQKNKLPSPVISSACPAVVRLIKVRYPEWVGKYLPLDVPMEVADRLGKDELVQEGYPLEEIGVFFISPCAAKLTSVRNPLGREKLHVDGVLAIADIYGPLLSKLNSSGEATIHRRAGGSGIRWAVTGGETAEQPTGSVLAADGLLHVARVLEDVMMGKLKEVKFIEGLACPSGCVGGPLTVENPYMAKARILALAKLEPRQEGTPIPGLSWQDLHWTKKIQPHSILKLDDDMIWAM